MEVKHLKKTKIALLGNPNSGKTTLFNALTGLNHKTGNFPGVTVEKKSGIFSHQETEIEIVDLPGIYSLNFQSIDEQIAFDQILFGENGILPDKILIVADATNLKRNLLLITQLIDLQTEVVLCLNMIDQVEKINRIRAPHKLEEILGIPVIPTDARSGFGLDRLKDALTIQHPISPKRFYSPDPEVMAIADEVRKTLNLHSPYAGFLISANLNRLTSAVDLPKEVRTACEAQEWNRIQAIETVDRYAKIASILREFTLKPRELSQNVSRKLDQILTHPISGLAIMLVVLFLIFQSIFSLASMPMDLIEGFFNTSNEWFKNRLPKNMVTDLLIDGVWAGLGGVIVFIPQIALLFGFVALLEESGYMARVSFITDRIMQKFGLNGKSVVPLVGGFACAVPAIMSTRTISNQRERLITLFILPLMSCSARLPVYTLLIALAVPDQLIGGVISLQGLVMLALYCLGFFTGLIVAFVMKRFVPEDGQSFFMLEMPVYRAPQWKNVAITVWEKSSSFVSGAGKVIITVSVVLWILASFGPGESFSKLNEAYEQSIVQYPDQTDVHNKLASARLEHSYAGKIGKAIEPFIQPLGYDWKIGISLITSFAAREVFVGTMATIYSLGSGEFEEKELKEVLKQEKRPDGSPLYSIATVLSLLVFYAFALQCMSTLATTWKETGSLFWTLMQFVAFTALAYGSAWLVYVAFS